jgi:hypothetical protein
MAVPTSGATTMDATAGARGPGGEDAAGEVWLYAGNDPGRGHEVGFAILPEAEGRAGLRLRVRVTDHPGATPLTVAEMPASGMVLEALAGLCLGHVDRARALEAEAIADVFRRSEGLVAPAW